MRRPARDPARDPAPEPAPLAFFAACPRGLEAALADELASLGAQRCTPTPGGVGFDGDRQVAYAANLWSRLSSRILRRVAHGRYRRDDDLYRLAADVPWESWFDARHTLRVDLSAVRSPLRSLNFATLRIKDGIVDRLRELSGQRPSIDTRHPDARVFGYLRENEATLYLDLSGEPLFKRGWRSAREDKGEAPLKENLAAGLLTLSGWTPEQPLYDPFCGSGTIVIEAAQIACDIAPGLSRPFGLERLLDHDRELWAALRGEAIRRAQQAGAAARTAHANGAPRLAASDIDPTAIEQTRRNLARAGIAAELVQLRRIDAGSIDAPFERPGFIVCNPPYGERIEAFGSDATRSIPAAGAPGAAGKAGAVAADTADEHEQAMRAFGAALKRGFGGWRVHVLSSDPGLPRQLGMKERRRTPLFNGALECRLFGFEIFARDADGTASAGALPTAIAAAPAPRS
ncbi:MAG: class I SAM-dependent RNA methyltransferase [Burkholderiaceae bacterium]